ncbi:MAG TPA: hypothetical protein VHU61_10710 [Solirubrobacteraceae bacterium]|nr:hypothetical protein [Solirubrobacteraceae bacterium]
MERDSLLFVDDDFDWSEPPQRNRRRMTESAARREPLDGYRARYEEPRYDEARYDEPRYDEPQYDDGPYAGDVAPQRAGTWDQPTAVHSHFDEMMEEWNAAYGSGVDRDLEERDGDRAFDLSDRGQGPSQGARRTVLITGHGDDRYLPAPRQRRSSELRFHERSGFSPDRAGLWAVLLSLALVIGAIAH